MNCKRNKLDICTICGRQFPKGHPGALCRISSHTFCSNLGTSTGEYFPSKNGLGDMISNCLSAIGITKERWSSLKREAPDCTGCSAKQKFFNWVGEKIGLPKGKGAELQKLIILEDLKLPISSCTEYGECLPHFDLPDSFRELCEHKICSFDCPHFVVNYVNTPQHIV